MNGRRWNDPDERWVLRSIQMELERKWKEREDRKGISKDARLKIELNKLPTHWIQAIYQELGYVERISKEEQVEYIAYILRNKRFLEKILVELSRSSLFILKYLLSRGGWATFHCLSRQANTDESDDGWWWEEEPPSSPLGQLRVRGLVFVGRTPIKRRFYKIGVIPRELRNLLEEILPRVYQLKNLLEQRRSREKCFSYSQEGDYLELLQEVRDYFNQIRWVPLLSKEQILDFLRYLREKNLPYQDLEQAWEDIQFFLYFVDSHSFDKKNLDDFKSWEFSYFVSRFIPDEYGGPELTYEETHRILHTIAELYRSLKKRGEIGSDVEIQKAITCILKEDGKIVRIPVPPAKGPEALLVTTIPGSNRELVFTNNDLWSTIVLYLQYEENWESMFLDLEKNLDQGIVDARRKKEYLLQLKRKLEKSRISPFHLLSSLKPDKKEIDKALTWFYKKKLLK